MHRHELLQYYSGLLTPDTFSDYGPNGLQVEGNEQIERIAFAVSATLESIEIAVQQQAQALVVHHGLFWHFHGCRPLTGPHGKRAITLARHNINLLAYHLPLDAHPETGNAACLGRAIGLVETQPFGDYKGSPTGICGRLQQSLNAAGLQSCLAELLSHPVLLSSPDPGQPVSTVGIITGGANSGWKNALDAGLDAYITGEMSEHDWHDSKEAGIHMLAGGHHATEQFGIQTLMQHTADRFGIDCIYIPSDNPA